MRNFGLVFRNLCGFVLCQPRKGGKKLEVNGVENF